MQKFQLELLFHIIGIGSASGIIFKNNSLFIISDNGGYLYEYKTETQSLEKNVLLDNPVLENIPKKEKPDFEAITNNNNDYYVFGSGSTENRNKMVHYNAENKQTKMHDVTDLYSQMQSLSGIKPEDFNIEGVVYNQDTWYFLQRGNGKNSQNGVFTITGNILENNYSILYNTYKLPKIKGVGVGFTDAVIVDKNLYFLASAEDSQSTYEDGEVLGTIIGCINIETMKIDFTKKISDKNKFEGVTVYKKNTQEIEFLLCEDNDSDVLSADIYKLTLNK